MGDYDYEIYQDGSWYSPKALGMTDPVLSLAAGAVSTLSFSVKKTPAETAPWAKKEVIRVRRVVAAGTTYDYLFNGKIVSEDLGETPEPSISYKAEDVWGELDRRPCEVLWDFDQATFNGSHLILFRDQDGEQMTVGEQIKDALDYAIDKGISISYTQAELDDLDEEPPSDEQSDLSVAQVIKRGLRWIPGCRAAIAYASDGSSVIHFERSDDQSQTPVSIDVTGGDILSYNVKDSENLRVDGGKIIYEVTNTDLNGASVSMISDEAGDPDGDNVLVNTIELEGSFTEPLSETIEVVPWPLNPALQADSVYNFWEAILPWFRNYMAGNVLRQISYVNSYNISPWPAALPNVLVSGSIHPWMGGSMSTAQTYCNYDYDCEYEGDRSYTEAPVVTTTNLTSGTYNGTLVNPGEVTV